MSFYNSSCVTFICTHKTFYDDVRLYVKHFKMPCCWKLLNKRDLPCHNLDLSLTLTILFCLTILYYLSVCTDWKLKSNKPPVIWLYPKSLVPGKFSEKKHLSNTCWACLKLLSILAEIIHPLHYKGWKATYYPPRVFKLDLTNFQAELNKQSRVLIVHAPFSLSKRHGLPLSHKLQCCVGTVMSSRIVKMTLVLHAWQKPNYPGLCLCQSLLMRERLVGMLQSPQWLAQGFFSFLSCAQSKSVLTTDGKQVRKNPAGQNWQLNSTHCRFLPLLTLVSLTELKVLLSNKAPLWKGF